MSLLDATSPTTLSTAQEASRRWWVLALARYTTKRREALGLTTAAAAELAGLQVSEWGGLETGWVPEDLATLRAIAGTLRVRWTDYLGLALLAGCHQEGG